MEATAQLDRLGCVHLADRRPATLSGGEQQRVAIARALATGADLLLLDEPFAALDPATRATCRTELAGLRRALGLTVVEVTHTLEEAGDHADRVVVLDGGRIVADGPYAELAAFPPDFRAARALGLPNLLPANLVGEAGGAWCFVPPSSVTIGDQGIALLSGAVSLDGTVEAVEDLGPVRRVRLRADRLNGPVRLIGFSAAGSRNRAAGLARDGVVLPPTRFNTSRTDLTEAGNGDRAAAFALSGPRSSRSRRLRVRGASGRRCAGLLHGSVSGSPVNLRSARASRTSPRHSPNQPSRSSGNASIDGT